MTILLQRNEIDRIEQQGAQSYPHECCGVLLGNEQDGRKVVTDIVPLPNARQDSPQNRFLILPEDLVRTEREARHRGLTILGYYHSHPDHPARPSNFDREHAWPWYTYLILAVEKGVPGSLTSWVLSEDRSAFLPEAMEIPDGTSPPSR